MAAKQRFYITLEPEHIERLRIMERATGATASAQIRRALARWFDEHAAVIRAEPRRNPTVETAPKARRRRS